MLLSHNFVVSGAKHHQTNKQTTKQYWSIIPTLSTKQTITSNLYSLITTYQGHWAGTTMWRVKPINETPSMYVMTSELTRPL